LVAEKLRVKIELRNIGREAVWVTDVAQDQIQLFRGGGYVSARTLSGLWRHLLPHGCPFLRGRHQRSACSWGGPDLGRGEPRTDRVTSRGTLDVPLQWLAGCRSRRPAGQGPGLRSGGRAKRCHSTSYRTLSGPSLLGRKTQSPGLLFSRQCSATSRLS
jgi:hypothetical protein